LARSQKSRTRLSPDAGKTPWRAIGYRYLLNHTYLDALQETIGKSVHGARWVSMQ
jgi:hypothetical protein